jgi:aminopeptidase 2
MSHRFTKKPIAARAAFPCWDEPSLKATFSVTMISRADTVNISNMPATSEVKFEPDAENNSLSMDLVKLLSTLSKEAQWKITKFQITPRMSSYLVAYANGPFSHLEKRIVMPLSGKTVPLRIYSNNIAL